MMKHRNVTTKEILLEMAESLPADATVFDAVLELEFRGAVWRGLAALDRGEVIALEEARKFIPEWTTKYSFPPKP